MSLDQGSIIPGSIRSKGYWRYFDTISLSSYSMLHVVFSIVNTPTCQFPLKSSVFTSAAKEIMALSGTTGTWDSHFWCHTLYPRTLVLWYSHTLSMCYVLSWSTMDYPPILIAFTLSLYSHTLYFKIFAQGLKGSPNFLAKLGSGAGFVLACAEQFLELFAINEPTENEMKPREMEMKWKWKWKWKWNEAQGNQTLSSGVSNGPITADTTTEVEHSSGTAKSWNTQVEPSGAKRWNHSVYLNNQISLLAKQQSINRFIKRFINGKPCRW